MARDFFDELSDTITRTTKDLGKKAGQLYEAQKIRSKISSEEQMVQKLKADIGNVICRQKCLLLSILWLCMPDSGTGES